MIALEVIIQIIIYARFFVNIGYDYFSSIIENKSNWIQTEFVTIYLSVYFLLTETLPLVFIMIGMFS